MRTYEELVKEAIETAKKEAATKAAAETTFEVGHVYEERYIGDSNLKVHYEVVNRTAKTVTVKDQFGSVRRCKIYTDSTEGEFTYTSGRYSMAPVLRAKRKVA